MKVRISDLSTGGHQLKEELSLDSMNTRMAEGRENDIIFVSPPVADITIYATASGAQVKGAVHTEYKQSCSLCLESVKRSVDIDVSFILKERPLDDTADQYEDDVGVVYYENDSAELDEVLEEAIILSLDIFWHPEFPKNRCAECKRTKEELGVSTPAQGTNLGALLKKAGVN